jgi:hypothetical protein
MANRLSAIGVVDSTAGFEACLDRREISVAPFGFHHAAGREKRPSAHTKTPLCGLHGKGTGCGI